MDKESVIGGIVIALVVLLGLIVWAVSGDDEPAPHDEPAPPPPENLSVSGVLTKIDVFAEDSCWITAFFYFEDDRVQQGRIYCDDHFQFRLNRYNELVLDTDDGRLLEVNCAKLKVVEEELADPPLPEEVADEVPLPTAD